MSENTSSGLKFIDYSVNDIEFYNNNEFKKEPVNIAFDVDRQINYQDDEKNTMFVTLNVDIFNNAKKNNYPFSLKINITGEFELDDKHRDEKTSFAEVNSIAILFPYVRALISTLTANFNVPPLILPPMNIVKLIENQKK